MKTAKSSKTGSAAGLKKDREIAAAISRWFGANARVLPWRVPAIGATSGRDPYHALVAEAMLQQTQVSRVLEKYATFIKRFPSAKSLAAAEADDVLSMWSGLGYYRRARSLHGAAKMIVEKFGGQVPRSVDQLRQLPGVGRYTAGAIASIAFDQPAPIVDGNVARVLLRIHGREAASDDKAVQGWLWEQAAALAAVAKSPAALNEGLMELGATVCLPPPGAPLCGSCPAAEWCRARELGLQRSIPKPKTAAARSEIYCASAIVRRGDGAMLVERRPDKGMWSRLWQAPTLERTDRMPTETELARAVGAKRNSLKDDGAFEFLATHRRLSFRVYRAAVDNAFVPERGEFLAPERIKKLALSSPQKRLLTGESGLF